jgi:anthranilate phosphoribosyltransferase
MTTPEDEPATGTDLTALIAKVAARESLSAAEAEVAFDRFMSGTATPVQMAALLMGLRTKGHTSAEVAGGVRALRRAMVSVDAGDPAEITDTCGTGGGTLTTFNISTAAAFVAAGAGARIAKHGNRSFTSRSGSADVLEALGVTIELPPAAIERVARTVGIVFLYAPAHHPAMRHVGPVRRELGIPTIMNLLGPLANPAGARRQMVGVSDPALLSLVAHALLELGHLRALVVYGEAGMDELSPLGPSRVAELDGGEIRELTVTPESLGLQTQPAEGLAGGEPDENARRIMSVLTGADQGAARAATLLNAGGALYVAGRAASLQAGVTLATASLDSGAALEKLEALKAGTAGG